MRPGERKTASGSQGILIKALIVMVIAETKQKHGRGGKTVTESEGWTEWLSDGWARRWGEPDTNGIEEMITVAEKGQYAAN